MDAASAGLLSERDVDTPAEMHSGQPTPSCRRYVCPDSHVTSRESGLLPSWAGAIRLSSVASTFQEVPSDLHCIHPCLVQIHGAPAFAPMSQRGQASVSAKTSRHFGHKKRAPGNIQLTRGRSAFARRTQEPPEQPRPRTQVRQAGSSPDPRSSPHRRCPRTESPSTVRG